MGNALNRHLFAALERLENDNLEGDQLRDEIDRAKAVCEIAGRVVDNSRTILEAARLGAQYGSGSIPKDALLLDEGD